MKILWLVNIIFPYPAEKMGLKKNVFGGWLLSSLNSLSHNNEVEKIAVVATYVGKQFYKIDDEKISYYVVPTKSLTKFNRHLENSFKNIIDEFNPDIIHINGTEFPHSLSMINASGGKVKTITSIQGLVYKYFNYFMAEIPSKDVIFNITLRDIIRHNNLYGQRKDFLKRGKYELEALKRSDYIIGRTSWDKACINDITDVKKYRFCNESLREVFYQGKWDINKINRNTIYISQASYPIKGFHKVLLAISILKKDYPDIVVKVAGANIIKRDNYIERLKIAGYGKYLIKLIKKLKLEENIEFIGLQSDKQVHDLLLKSHVFVQASSIENSPNSLGEAMLLGVPIVASYVGGTADMLKDKEEGLLYPFSESEMLAKYIKDIFSNDELAVSLGNNAQKHAKITHSLDYNSKKLFDIYKEVVNNEKN